MDSAAESTILQHLAPGFEQKLFLAAIATVDDTSNKLRLNNFAYSMRELIRIVLERLAPDTEVVNAPWFNPNDKDHPDKVTRSQRIKYAIQGWLSDDYVTNTLRIDHQDDDKELRKNIDELSKYTHVTESTFNIEPVKITELTLGVLCNVQLFLMNVAEARYQVQQAAIDCMDEEMIEEFYYNVQNNIDILATHHEILAYMVTGINLKNQDNDTITLEVIGNVQVRLQWGSDGDMRRGDGYETQMSFPFSSTLIASYKNEQGDVHIVSRTIDINTDQFYQ